MNINKKFLGWSIILPLLSVYVLPGRTSVESKFKYGYPFGFFDIPKNGFNPGAIILSSTSLNIVFLTANIILIYFIINFISKKLFKLS